VSIVVSPKPTLLFQGCWPAASALVVVDVKKARIRVLSLWAKPKKKRRKRTEDDE
jgi:hypothetical protein